MTNKTKLSDSRFDVNTDTQLINGIKKNNETMDLLNQLDGLVQKFYRNWCDEGAGIGLIYKDEEGNEIEIFDFWNRIDKFVQDNNTYLLRDSKTMYEKLTKKRK